MKIQNSLFIFFFSCFSLACDGSGSATESAPGTEDNSGNDLAVVSAVSISGETGNYSFSVTVESPDTGCNQYADWWEVISLEGDLLYRRILTHSHVDEQPFTRSGGPVAVSSDREITIRAHMNSSGYGEQVFTGSVDQGLLQQTISSSFAGQLEIVDPLPTGCAF